MDNSHAPDSLLRTALGYHQEGKLNEAEALYRQVLETDAHQPHALSMLGMIVMNDARHAEAESIFLRHLNVAPGNPLTLHSLGRLFQMKGNHRDAVGLFRRAAAGQPDLAPIFNDLAVSLHHLGQNEDALAALDQALAIDAAFAVAHNNRGRVLYDCHRFEEAVKAHLAALVYTPTDAILERESILFHFADAAYEARDFVLAASACRSILELNPDNADAIEHLTKILYRLGRESEALSLLNQRSRAQGLIRKGKTEHPEATILILGAVGAAHVPTRYLFDPALFGTMTLTMLSPDQPDAPLGNVRYEVLAKADLIFNTLGEVEKDGGQTEAVNALQTHLQKPLLNLPSQVRRTGRDQAQVLYGDIPGLVVPRVRRIMRDEVIDPAVISSPFLIRPSGAHGGEDLALIRTLPDIDQYFANVPYHHFLMTDFHDFKGAQNCYRKYRFIFIDRQPYPYHLAIAGNWLVHYWRAEMERANWKMREEEVFLNDWRSVFSPQAAAAVEQVAYRMDLDYSGMDCSILPTGEVLFFEANACMLMHMDDAAGELAYKQAAVHRIRDAMTSMVRRRTS